MKVKFIKASVRRLDDYTREEILKKIEKCGRICYKSESKITEDSAARFVRGLTKSGHHSVLEHVNLSYLIVCDRGVSHQIVRHRIASYSQESTRYCDYQDSMTFIEPSFLDDEQDYTAKKILKYGLEKTAECYKLLREQGQKPEEARAVLPNALKTELVMTANLREWLHFIKIRCDKASHPQIREIADMIREDLEELLPEVFKA